MVIHNISINVLLLSIYYKSMIVKCLLVGIIEYSLAECMEEGSYSSELYGKSYICSKTI